ncbi:MAG: glycosyltransferase family 4 protein [Candidatus Bathyarchaeia archaeon]
MSHEYPPFIYGGIGTFAYNLAKGLSKINLKVTVISGYPTSNMLCTPHPRKHLLEDENSVKVLRFPYPNVPPRHTMFQLSNFKQLSKIINEINPDVIHGQSGSTFPLLTFLGNTYPLVVTFHTSLMAQRTLSAYSLLRGGSWRDFLTYVIGYPAWLLTFKKELERSRLAVSVSKNLKLDLLSELGEAYDEKIHIIHNGIDIESLDKAYRKETTLETNNNEILFAGRLFWGKGALTIIKLAHLIQKNNLNFKIVIHGEGPLLKKLKFAVYAYKLTNIELKGFANKAQLIRSIKLCKYVLIPSFYEACPMILLESMCLGKVPVMFNLPYAREFTENGEYGILAKNVEDMVLKIKTIAKQNLLEHLGQKIQSYARKKYDINEIAKKYSQLYKLACDLYV